MVSLPRCFAACTPPPGMSEKTVQLVEWIRAALQLEGPCAGIVQLGNYPFSLAGRHTSVSLCERHLCQAIQSHAAQKSQPDPGAPW